MGLDPRKHLGKDIGFLKSYLHRLKEYVEFFFFCFFFFNFLMGKAFIKFMSRSINALFIPMLLHRLYGINVCGEGGEYETLTLDCPLFIVS